MSQNSLEADVLKLVSDRGRNVGSPGHIHARGYIAERLAGLGLTPYVGDSFILRFGADNSHFANIVGQITGSSPELAPILLGAHYDTCGDLPGADDNAAAISILLSVGESLAGMQRERSVLLTFFDSEEPPHFLEPTMGSIRFFEDQQTSPTHVAVILDLVGHDVPVPGMEDLLFVVGVESDPGLEKVLVQSEPPSGLRTVPTQNSYVGDLSDHHIFRKNSLPYLLLTCGHWEHYHASTDTPDKLNFGKMEAIAGYLTNLVEILSDSILEGPFEGNETLPMEIYFLNKNIVPALRESGIGLSIRTRTDVDQLVALLMTRFGL
ncbi:MAG: M28 family peptidase [Chloroflexi bacterium]|nr:M28 family peptidase [Chloroflexota bacterium]